MPESNGVDNFKINVCDDLDVKEVSNYTNDSTPTLKIGDIEKQVEASNMIKQLHIQILSTMIIPFETIDDGMQFDLDPILPCWFATPHSAEVIVTLEEQFVLEPHDPL